jgi:GTP-binding protein EngB required for normal cell division
METRKKNILVIGETGVGKSSIVNLIVGEKVAEAKGSADKCTFNIDKYEYENFRLFDTIGYNDATENNPTEALKKLANFAMEVTTDGICLIVYVMKQGRINAISRKNYDYFVKSFCNNEVPVLLVVTHCEEVSIPEHWYSSEKENFEKYGMIFNAVVCGCAIDLSSPKLDADLVPIYKKKVTRTQQGVRDEIKKLALQNPWKPSNWSEWVPKIIIAAAIILGLAVAGPIVIAAIAALAAMKSS